MAATTISGSADLRSIADREADPEEAEYSGVRFDEGHESRGGSAAGWEGTVADGSEHSGTSTSPAAPTCRRTVLYPNHCCWFVLFSALDIMLTHTILERFEAFNGRELNTFADFVIRQAGLPGAIGLKSASIMVVITALEYVGRRRPTTGRTLMNCVVAMSIVPVAFALVQLGAVGLGWVTAA